MPRSTSNSNRISFLILAVFMPVLLYVLMLSIKIPYSFSRFFVQYSFLMFIIIISLYGISYYLQGLKGWVAGISLTLVLFALSLSYKWTSGLSNSTLIGGLLPYKDAYNYYNAARAITSGNLIPRFNAASWHPLFSSFLAIVYFFTNHNLQISLALITGIAGFACYISSRQILEAFGFFPAAIYASLLFLYMPTGIAGSEAFGLTVGCLALFLLLNSAKTLKVSFFLAGLFILVAALSIRPGTFFVLLALIFWAGYIFRGEKRFSFKIAGLASILIVAAFLVNNMIFPRLIVEEGDTSFGNFAHVLYGQVMGGTGWTRAIQDLGTYDSGIIFQAAFQEFIQHPWSFFIGAAKAYRDFFFPSTLGFLNFVPTTGMHWIDILIWIACLLLLIWGVVCSIRKFFLPLASLLLSSFLGVMLSIPFLPPIDGGNRFYAATIAFLFALLVFGLSELLPKTWKKSIEIHPGFSWAVPAVAIILVSVNLILPPIILKITREPTSTITICPLDQVPFVVQVYPGSYIDLVQDNSACGLAPEICIGDFIANGSESSVDDFYQALVNISKAAEVNLMLFPANDLISNNPHFFYGNSDMLPSHTHDHLISGCASEIRTEHQSIYQVISTNTSIINP
jgi:hypothetical protein